MHVADFSSWGLDLPPAARLDVGMKLFAFRYPIDDRPGNGTLTPHIAYPLETADIRHRRGPDGVSTARSWIRTDNRV